MSEQKQKMDHPLGGLYSKVNISVKTLDKVIVGGIAVMLLVIFLGLSNRGYTVSFDTMGGTRVESQLHMYGDYLEDVEIPTREGYEFDGWYQDENCIYPFDMEQDKIIESITLYAKWK